MGLFHIDAFLHFVVDMPDDPMVCWIHGRWIHKMFDMINRWVNII